MRLSIPDELPLVPCNYAQIDHVLTNLLENAARHTPPGTAIDLSLELQPDAVWVRVADAGPGIAVGDRERVSSCRR